VSDRGYGNMSSDAIESELRQVSFTLKESRTRLRSAEREAAMARSQWNAASAEARVLRHTLAWRRWFDGIGVVRFLPVVTIPSALATAVFVCLDARTGKTTTSGIVAGLVFAGLTGLMAYCLLVRSDEAVDARLDDVSRRLPTLEDEAKKAAGRVHAERARIAPVKARQQTLQRLLDMERQSVAYKCQKLFDRRWREYRGAQFEDYLAEVFDVLGYTVQQTGQSGDHGVDLIVKRNGRTVAIQAKGYTDSVGNAAVREAYAGKDIYRCHACAVITNSRFTPKAIEAAEKLGCCLIHEDNFRAFVFDEVGFGT